MIIIKSELLSTCHFIILIEEMRSIHKLLLLLTKVQ